LELAIGHGDSAGPCVDCPAQYGSTVAASTTVSTSAEKPIERIATRTGVPRIARSKRIARSGDVGENTCPAQDPDCATFGVATVTTSATVTAITVGRSGRTVAAARTVAGDQRIVVQHRTPVDGKRMARVVGPNGSTLSCAAVATPLTVVTGKRPIDSVLPVAACTVLPDAVEAVASDRRSKRRQHHQSTSTISAIRSACDVVVDAGSVVDDDVTCTSVDTATKSAATGEAETGQGAVGIDQGIAIHADVASLDMDTATGGIATQATTPPRELCYRPPAPNDRRPLARLRYTPHHPEQRRRGRNPEYSRHRIRHYLRPPCWIRCARCGRQSETR
jgi:hypothetical protein